MADALGRARPGTAVEIKPIRTSGDERPGEPRPEGGGEGASTPRPLDDKSRFVREIEEALLAGAADLAVHSAKDVPGELPDGLAIVSVPRRADPRDVVCGASSLGDVREGARVGTSSLRRRAQLLALRPDLEVSDLRGNVDTRLRRLAEGRYDAVVLAAAGLGRLGRSEGAVLAPEQMTPAPGQGCLALEARADDRRTRALAELVLDEASRVRLAAERALVRALEATCRTPVGAHAEIAGGRLRLSAFVGLPDGSAWIRDEVDGEPDEPAALGAAVAERLLSAGASEILRTAESTVSV